MSEAVDTAEFETEKDAGSGDAGLVKLWLAAIDLASKEEEDWRKEAEGVVKTYRNGDARDLGSTKRQHNFNILYSNIETICPAVYNSTPIPDVRTRVAKVDPVAKEAGDFLERCLSYDLDVDDFDTAMDLAVKDNELVGRGVTRVRYVPYITNDQETGEQIAWEDVPTEHVPWANFRRGPARGWEDVPWIAFELFLTREQLIELSPECGGKVNLDFAVSKQENDKTDSPPAEIFKRARVWEIWDKDKKQVVFIATGYQHKPIQMLDDPLGLTGFFPIPRPLNAVETSDTLDPIPPYRMYKDQAEELSRVTRRITALIQMLKVRGIRDGQIQEFEDIADADDGEFVAMQDATALYGQGATLDKAIWMMPIDVISGVIQGLYLQREQIKQVIYEITGIADILRGASDPNETLGAQQIKAQFGSQRVQKKQKEAARYARDLLRIKSELIANKFQPQTLQMMSGIQLPSMQDKQAAEMQIQQLQAQAQQTGQEPQIPEELNEILKKPTFEEVLQLLRSDIQRQYRVDVESDSTIRADLARSQENMSMFLQGTAQFLQAAGPAVQAGMLPGAVAVEIFSSFARNFKLGKSAEDALSTLTEQAKEKEGQPDPAQQAQQQAQEFEQQKQQFELQSKQMDMQMKQQEHEFKLAEMQMSMEIKREEMRLKQEELAMKEREMGIEAQLTAMRAQAEVQSANLKAQSQEHSTRLGMEAAEHKAKMSKQPKEDA